MYHAVVRSKIDRTLPPAVIRAETADGIRHGMLDLEPQEWECVLLVEGEEIDREAFFTDKEEIRFYD